MTALPPTLLVARRDATRSAAAVSLLQAQDFIVLPPVFDGLQALDTIRLLKPTVAILACDLPGLAPVGVLKRLTAGEVPTRFVVHTTNPDPAAALDAFRLGALGYLHCDAGPDELLACVRSVLRGELCLSQNLLGGLLDVALQAIDNEPSGYRGLSRRELEIFEFIGQGQSTHEISRRILPFISENTVESHRKNIRRKLGITGGGSALLKEAIAYAQKKGGGGVECFDL